MILVIRFLIQRFVNNNKELIILNKTEEALIYILSQAIHGKKANNLKFENINWEHILNLARAHDVQALLYTALKENNDESDLWIKFIHTLKQITMSTTVRMVRNNFEMSRVLNQLKESKIPVIALKGIFLKNLYPFPELRTMGDVDLLVPFDYLDLSRSIIEKFGYYEGGPDEKCIHFNHNNCFPIELHWKILNQDNFKLSMEEFEKEIFDNVIPSNICGIEISTLGIIDQMLHLTFHMISHILYMGFGLRQICDFVLYTESVSNVIDWDELLNKADKLGIKNFLVSILGVCNQLFGLEIPMTNVWDAQGQNIINSLIDDIIKSGTFGLNKNEWQYGYSLANKINEEGIKISLNPRLFFRKINIIFINVKKRYKYVQKHSLLFPIACLHHFVLRVNYLIPLMFLVKKREKLFKSLDLR